MVVSRAEKKLKNLFWLKKLICLIYYFKLILTLSFIIKVNFFFFFVLNLNRL